MQDVWTPHLPALHNNKVWSVVLLHHLDVRCNKAELGSFFRHCRQGRVLGLRVTQTICLPAARQVVAVGYCHYYRARSTSTRYI